MWRYLGKRLALAIPTLFGITLITFAVVHLAPGDPALHGVAEGGITPDTYARLRTLYHLDDPLPVRYVRWLGDLVRLDFGRSFHDGRAVTEKIAERLPPTLILTASALLLSVLVAIPLGIHTAASPGSWFDRIVAASCFGIYATPRYVLAMLLIVFVGVRWQLLPFMGIRSDEHGDLSRPSQVADLIRHGVLIGLCFAAPLTAYLVRFVRANIAVILSEDFIRTARMKGAGEFRVLYVHALRNALPPILTLLGLMAPAILGGSVILEVMFSWPGMGRLLFEGIMERDYPVVMALATISAVLVLAATLLVDLLHAAVDPRVRLDR